MRIEPYTTGSYLHVLKRGARGIDIVHDESDMWRFLRILFFMNDEHVDFNWSVITKGKGLFYRPDNWPKQKPLVNILCYTLMPNHIHLLLKEIRKGGTSLFMKKIGQSMTEHANLKYKEKGSLFQGAYKSKTIKTDEYLCYVAVYIMVKNVFELYPKNGLIGAQKNFEDAWKWANTYSFSSLGDYSGMRNISPVIEKEIFKDFFDTSAKFKSFSRDIILAGKWKQAEFE